MKKFILVLASIAGLNLTAQAHCPEGSRCAGDNSSERTEWFETVAERRWVIIKDVNGSTISGQFNQVRIDMPNGSMGPFMVSLVSNTSRRANILFRYQSNALMFYNLVRLGLVQSLEANMSIDALQRFVIPTSHARASGSSALYINASQLTSVHVVWRVASISEVPRDWRSNLNESTRLFALDYHAEDVIDDKGTPDILDDEYVGIGSIFNLTYPMQAIRGIGARIDGR